MPEDIAKRARRRLWEWSHARGSHFVMHLFDLAANCDPMNLSLLAMGFPEEINVFKKYRFEEGYFNELDGEFAVRHEEDK